MSPQPNNTCMCVICDANFSFPSHGQYHMGQGAWYVMTISKATFYPFYWPRTLSNLLTESGDSGRVNDNWWHVLVMTCIFLLLKAWEGCMMMKAKACSLTVPSANWQLWSDSIQGCISTEFCTGGVLDALRCPCICFKWHKCWSK